MDKKRESNTKATKNYREKNRCKINSISRKYYDNHKNDPEWLQKTRERQRLNYKKKMALKAINTNVTEPVESLYIY